MVMALTGAIGVGYVLAHMIGNLQVFAGAEKINAYAAFLKSNSALLWTARSILIAAVTLHIVAAYQFGAKFYQALAIGTFFYDLNSLAGILQLPILFSG